MIRYQNQPAQNVIGQHIMPVEGDNNDHFSSQVSVAKQYPRNLMRVQDKILEIIAMNKERAASCRYAVPRAGKTIAGPSVHLARIIAQNYQNLRFGSRIVRESEKTVVAQGICFDIENNTLYTCEEERSIIGKNGTRYSQDLIILTGKAAAAIAMRNAIFNVIPTDIRDTAYQKAQEIMLNDLSDDTKLLQGRAKMFKEFEKSFGVTKVEVLKYLNFRTETQIKPEDVMNLRGLFVSLKDGSISIDEIFPKNEPKEEKPLIPMADQIKNTMKVEVEQVEEKVKQDDLDDIKIALRECSSTEDIDNLWSSIESNLDAKEKDYYTLIFNDKRKSLNG